MTVTRLVIAVVAVCGAHGALAQTPPKDSASPPAVTQSPTPPTASEKSQSAPRADETPPLSGANSFTENQAKERVADAGFTQISSLTKDAQGIWRGTATKGGQQVNVAVDFRGNVVQNK